MSKRALAVSKKAARKIERSTGELAETDARASPIANPIATPIASPIASPISGHVASPFFSFRYSYTEISAVGGDRAKVRRSETRLQDGKLAHEAFEGELQRSVIDPLLNQAREQFAQQTALLMRSFTWFLPSARKPTSERD
jgi:hypothetical protein